MIAIFDSTGEVYTATSTNTTTRYSYPIAPNIDQWVAFTQLSTYVKLSVEYLRNNVTVATMTPIVSEGMRLNMSIFTTMVEPLTTKFNKSLPTTTYDKITFTFTGPSSSDFVTIPVSNVSCVKLGGHGFSKGAGNLWALSLRDSWVNKTGITVVKTEGIRCNGWRDGMAYKVTGATTSTKLELASPAPLTTNDFGFGKVVVSFSFKDYSSNGYRVSLTSTYVQEFANTVITVPGDFDGEIKFDPIDLKFNGESVRIYIQPISGVTSTINFAATRMMMNRGNQHRQWCASPGDVSVSSKAYSVGSCTDYEDGYAILPVDFINTVSPISGAPLQQKIFMGSPPSNVGFTGDRMYLSKIPTQGIPIENGYTLNEPATSQYITSTGPWAIMDANRTMTYALLRYKRDPIAESSCRMALQWLNSKGFYDMLYTQNFTSRQVLTEIPGAGNKVDHYAVVAVVPLDFNNEYAMKILSRSTDVRAILPDSPGEYGRVVIDSATAVTTSGTTGTKMLQIRMKVYLTTIV